MTGPSPRTMLLQVSEHDQLGTVTVDSDNFERFADEFELRLDQLVEAWKHVASPNAQRIRRTAISPNNPV